MATLSALKGGVIAASAVSLFIFSPGTGQPVVAAVFTASGRFASDFTFDTSKPPVGDPLVKALAEDSGGSFDGVYSVTGLPVGSNTIPISSWLFHLRNSSGTILRTLSSSQSGSSANVFQVNGTYGLGDVLLFADSDYQLQLEFAPGFTGTGPIRPVQVGSFSALLKRTSDQSLIGIGIASGSSQPIPTPALLPGLIGMGLGVWRRRKAQTPSDEGTLES